MVSVDSQPFSSCAMVRAAITADCRWSGGYFAAAWSIFASAPGLNIVGAFILLTIDLSEDDVLRADDRDDVRNHVAARHLVQGREMHEARSADFHPVRLVGAVR